MKKYLSFASVLALAGIVLAGCSTTTPTSEVSQPDTAVETETTATDVSVTGEVITVEMANFKFNPTTIRAKAGTTLKLKITDTQGSHDFVIDELNVQSDVFNTGETKEIMIEIPAADAGKTFEYYCSVMNHRQMGMVGKLIIE